MADAVDSQVVANVSMTASEVAYTVPDDVGSIIFRARGGKIEFRTTSGGDYFTIDHGSHLDFSGRQVEGATFYFTGPNTAVLEILYWVGFIDTANR